VTNLNLPGSDIAIPSSVFSVITLITLVIFLRGQTKEPESQTLHSLVAISLKFLLELVLVLIWFIVAKKTSLPSVLIFFVLYLTFTLFSIWVILRTLKGKSL
jgi:Ca2+/Na+ antiporter